MGARRLTSLYRYAPLLSGNIPCHKLVKQSKIETQLFVAPTILARFVGFELARTAASFRPQTVPGSRAPRALHVSHVKKVDPRRNISPHLADNLYAIDAWVDALPSRGDATIQVRAPTLESALAKTQRAQLALQESCGLARTRPERRGWWRRRGRGPSGTLTPVQLHELIEISLGFIKSKRYDSQF